MLKIDKHSDFSIHNLPFGIFSNGGGRKVGVAIGEFVFDLSSAVDAGWFPEIPPRTVHTDYLNELIGLGKEVTSNLRKKLQELFQSDNHYDTFLVERTTVEMHLPVQVGDYTDFYSSMEHAINVGKLYRDPEKALLPNWKHMPVAYHGRASSIVVSGTQIRRPQGQSKKSSENQPTFGPTQALDFELETAFIIGKNSDLGTSVSVEQAEEYIFGMVLLNDWSARDIQKWEYVPLGPFLGKNFATSISAWVVPLEALQDFKVAGPKQEPEVLDYLKFEGDHNINLNLEVRINGSVVATSNLKYLYWNMRQQLAHHTVNGCNLKVGDLLASGTISGPTSDSLGSLLELSEGGKISVPISDGEFRTFLEDGDVVTIRGFCEKNGKRVGFGEVTGTIEGVKINEDGEEKV